ncbi:MAG TPA: hypothetical protein VNL96_09710 [Gemmatimonadaceae bacterium]|nr:hypothetical protein [Gemmatimonadaceae bacterium]
MAQTHDQPEVGSQNTSDTPPTPATPAIKRSPGHRGQDIRDTMAELAAKAQEISQEAGSKMAAALRDVINAAAGISEFAVESARELVQYMVRRGQMSQDEADRLIREAEAANERRPKAKPAVPAPPAEAPKAKASPKVSSPRAATAAKKAPKPATKPKGASKASTGKKAPARKAASKSSSRPAARKK